MRKVSSLQDVQLVLNTINDRLDRLNSKPQDLHGLQIKNAGNAKDPQDLVTLSQLQSLELGQMPGQLRAHQIVSVSASSLTGNISAVVGNFNSISVQQLLVPGSVNISGGNLTLTGGSQIIITGGGGISASGRITAGVSVLTQHITSNIYTWTPPSIIAPLTPPFGPQYQFDLMDKAGSINCVNLTAWGFGFPTSNAQGNIIAGSVSAQTQLLIGTGQFKSVSTTQLQWSPDSLTFYNFPTNKLYSEYTGTTTTLTAGGGFQSVPSVSITVNATGTWLIIVNVACQQPTTGLSVLGLFRNGVVGSSQVAVTGTGVNGFTIPMHILISLTNGDVMTLKLSPTTNNCAVLGTADFSQTNMCAIYMGA